MSKDEPVNEQLDLVKRIEKFQRDLEVLAPPTPLKVLRGQFRHIAKLAENGDNKEFSTILGQGTKTTYTGVVEFTSPYEAQIYITDDSNKKYWLGIFMDEADDYNAGINMNDGFFSLATEEPGNVAIDENWFSLEGNVNEAIAGPTGVFAIEVLRAIHQQTEEPTS